jgi:hypothetical protein
VSKLVDGVSFSCGVGGLQKTNIQSIKLDTPQFCFAYMHLVFLNSKSQSAPKLHRTSGEYSENYMDWIGHGSRSLVIVREHRHTAIHGVHTHSFTPNQQLCGCWNTPRV